MDTLFDETTILDTMKRFYQRLATVALAALLLTVGGCDLTELNDDPNSPTDATTEKLLTNAQIDLANQYWRDYAGAYWMRYAQYFTTNQYTDADRYRFPTRRSGVLNGHWENFYFVLNDLQEIIRFNERSPQEAAAFGPNANQVAIAKILQAWTFQLMTDIWGPIPFTDALQGRSDGNFAPTYTSQPEVYSALIDSLSAASQMIDTGAPTLSSGDLMYGGDMSKWKKFANALKMRVAMRMSDRRPQEAATAINEAIAAGTFESNDDNALVPFNQSPPYQNPIYENYEVSGRDDWAAPKSIVDLMNAQEDPRRSAFFTDADADSAGNQFNGFPYGLPQGEAQSLFTDPNRDFSRPGLRVRQPDAPAILLLYDEVLFIKAEAAQRGWNVTGDATSNFEAAVRASIDWWNPDAGSDRVDAYVDAVMSDLNTSSFEQVLGEQKWIALYFQGVQGWSEWRRLDFEGWIQEPSGGFGGQAGGNVTVPVRLDYPDSEFSVNEANVRAAAEQQFGSVQADHLGSRIWWDTEAPPAGALP